MTDTIDDVPAKAAGVPCGSVATFQRAGRHEVILSDHPIPGTGRNGQDTMGQTVWKPAFERFRHRL
jgi:hypothetical protein